MSAQRALVVSSGMAALDVITRLLRPGDEVVTGDVIRGFVGVSSSTMVVFELSTSWTFSGCVVSTWCTIIPPFVERSPVWQP
jgi:cystathionine beta-lyase/cystathionine gamma-synthase